MKFLIFIIIISGAAGYWYYGMGGNGTPSDITVSMNQEFKIKKDQKATLQATDFSITLESLIKSDCSGNDCIVGTGLVLKFKKGQVEEKGVNLLDALGHTIAIKDSDYETYAKLVITK